jgi:hypothetical protein
MICPYYGVGYTLSLHVQDSRTVEVTSPMNVDSLGAPAARAGLAGPPFKTPNRERVEARRSRLCHEFRP